MNPKAAKLNFVKTMRLYSWTQDSTRLELRKGDEHSNSLARLKASLERFVVEIHNFYQLRLEVLAFFNAIQARERVLHILDGRN